MGQQWTRQRVVALFLAVLLAGGSGFSVAGQDQQKPATKENGKKANPLKALQDEFSKGVSVTEVSPKDLPTEISKAAGKNAPGASIKKARKQEIRHTLKYVAFDKAKVQRFRVVVVKDGQHVRLHFAADGKKLDATPSAAKNKQAGQKKKAADAKEIDIPAKASKAVQAIKKLYPDAVVKAITTEVYQDPSGVVDVLTYEIEFITKGNEREMVASPDGVIPHLWKTIAAQDLPRNIVDNANKEVPGGKIESAARFEVRAGLRFVPLDQPRVVYRLDLEKDGKASKLNLRADGTPVPAPVRPGARRAYLGLEFANNNTTVSRVAPEGPAARAGIKAGDKILALGKANIGSVPDLLKALQTMKSGSEVQLRFARDDQTRTVTVKLGEPPSP